ncbi:unnamed protein product [Musa acuminata subsp. malaccensis]|uniref:(wild Malaysian banana) hypothetical protein n=1 Tax=Musa acuminata subsp. malaccensis TaxID=214687 RepID=A0A804JQG6_MUSAM|nr:unnamed protein product [Musa acuminata subsp. malaccensis]
MELVVEILTGRFFHVEVEDDATVGSLKKAIASKEMFQEQRLVLMLSNGRLLRDDQCALAECGVVDGSIIYLFFTSVGNPNWLTFFEDFVTFFDADPNKTPRGFGVIDRVKEDKACPWTVLALVARDVVVLDLVVLSALILPTTQRGSSFLKMDPGSFTTFDTGYLLLAAVEARGAVHL